MNDRSPDDIRRLFAADKSAVSPGELDRMDLTRRRTKGGPTADKIAWSATAREDRLPGADLLRRYPQPPGPDGPTTEQARIMEVNAARLRAREQEVPWRDWAGYLRFQALGGA
jgi:hypothetical protein